MKLNHFMRTRVSVLLRTSNFDSKGTLFYFGGNIFEGSIIGFILEFLILLEFYIYYYSHIISKYYVVSVWSFLFSDLLSFKIL